VVNDKNWANIIPELGDGGWINDQTGKTWKIKDTTNMHGKKTITDAVLSGRKHTIGEKNYQFEGWYVTPYGTFDSLLSAVSRGKELKKENDKADVILSESVLKKYCRVNNNKLLNYEGRRIPKSWRGKTPNEIGFNFIKKDNNNEDTI
jgi:hypothetical protein